MTAVCAYCDRLGHYQEDCVEWQQDEILRMSSRAKQRTPSVAPKPENQHQSVPGRMTFTVLERK